LKLDQLKLEKLEIQAISDAVCWMVCSIYVADADKIGKVRKPGGALLVAEKITVATSPLPKLFVNCGSFTPCVRDRRQRS